MVSEVKWTNNSKFWMSTYSLSAEMASQNTQYIQGPKMDWTEDADLHKQFKDWRKEAELSLDTILSNIRSQETKLKCVSLWAGKEARTYPQTSTIIWSRMTKNFESTQSTNWSILWTVCAQSRLTHRETEVQHDGRLLTLLETARMDNLSLNPDKIQFKSTDCKFFRHRLTPESLKPDLRKSRP